MTEADTRRAVLAEVARRVAGLTTWPRVSWFAYDAQVRGVPVNPTEDRIVVDRTAVLAIIDELREGAAKEEAMSEPHPGEWHEWRTRCLRCGGPGMLNVSIIGPDERVRITPVDRPLDVDLLREALHAADPNRYAECYHGLTVSDCGIDAEDIVREYALRESQP